MRLWFRLASLCGVAVMLGAAAPSPNRAPAKLALMIAGIGYAEAPSLAAVELPPAIGLAMSPYGAHLQAISRAARQAGHELIMGLPMQPDDSLTSDEGPKALDPDATQDANQQRLDWALARAKGYDGVTNALGAADGGGFMQRPSALTWLTGALAKRHLFFVATPASAMSIPAAHATALIDPDQGVAATQGALNQLVSQARASGSALGIICEPAPKTLALLGPWLRQLAGSGVTLTPVRDLVSSR